MYLDGVFQCYASFPTVKVCTLMILFTSKLLKVLLKIEMLTQFEYSSYSLDKKEEKMKNKAGYLQEQTLG